MTPLPKKKHTSARSKTRRNAATNRLKLVGLITCQSCKKLKEPHKVCPSCGSYK